MQLSAPLELNRISFSSRASFHRTERLSLFSPLLAGGDAWPSFYPSRSTFRERSSRVSWTKFLDSSRSIKHVWSILMKFRFNWKRIKRIEGRILRFEKMFDRDSRPLEINCWSWWIAWMVARSRWLAESRKPRDCCSSKLVYCYLRLPDAINRLRWLLYQLALVAFRPRTTANHSAPSTIDPPFSHRICSTKFISSL